MSTCRALSRRDRNFYTPTQLLSVTYIYELVGKAPVFQKANFSHFSLFHFTCQHLTTEKLRSLPSEAMDNLIGLEDIQCSLVEISIREVNEDGRKGVSVILLLASWPYLVSITMLSILIDTEL